MKKIILFLFAIILIHKTQAQSSNIFIGDSLYARGNYAKAIEIYKQCPIQSNVSHKIAKAYVEIGNYDKALFHYKKSIEDKTNEITLYQYGKLLSKTKDFSSASNIFKQLSRIDSKNPNYHYQLGLASEQLKDTTAISKFYHVYKLDKTHQKAIYKIAKFHLSKKAHDSVNKYVDLGLKLYANNTNLISVKAQSLYSKKDYYNAISWFKKLLSLNKPSKTIHEKLSHCYYRCIMLEKAIEQTILALEFDPKNASNLFFLGKLYYNIKDFENAEKFMLESISILDVPLDDKYIELASIYNRQKKYKKAIENYNKAIDEDPTNEWAHFYLASTKEAYYKDFDARISQYENFMKKFPNSKLKESVEHRINELKKEKFLAENPKI